MMVPLYIVTKDQNLEYPNELFLVLNIILSITKITVPNFYQTDTHSQALLFK